MSKPLRFKLNLQTFADDPVTMTLEEALSGEELLVYSRNLAIPNNYLYPLLFPSRETSELTVDTLKRSTSLPVLAQISDLGTETKYGSRRGMTGDRIEIPKLQRGRWMDERLLRILLQGRLRNNELSELRTEQLDDAKYCTDAIRALKEWISMQAIYLGKVDYSDDDVRILVDYGYTTEQKPTLSGTDKWDDNDNSNPLEDMQTWTEAMYDKGIILTRALTSRKIISLLLQNLSIRRQYFGNPSGSAQPPQMNLGQLNEVLTSLELPRIARYDTVAEMEEEGLNNGKPIFTTIRMAPQDRFVMLPEGPLGDYLWAQSTESMVDGIEAEVTGDMGLYVFRDLTSKHPIRVRTVGVNLAWPSFPWANTVISAKVI